MKKNNIFSLAISYDAYLKHSQSTNAHSHHEPNIFRLQRTDHRTEQELSSSKSYEIVGLKELTTYKNRMKKMHKLTAKRQTLPKSERPSSKGSTRREANDLLDRQEVIECLPKLAKNKTQKQLQKRKRESWMTEFSESKGEGKYKMKRMGAKHYANEFSVSRIKDKLKVQENEWKKVFLTDHENAKFPSIHKSIENYRTKAEQKQKNSLHENQQHIKSSVWSQILRSNMNLINVYDKKAVARTFHDAGEFTTRGNSKLKLESVWLEKKDSEGYRFKLHATEPSPKAK